MTSLAWPPSSTPARWPTSRIWARSFSELNKSFSIHCSFWHGNCSAMRGRRAPPSIMTRRSAPSSMFVCVSTSASRRMSATLACASSWLTKSDAAAFSAAASAVDFRWLVEFVRAFFRGERGVGDTALLARLRPPDGGEDATGPGAVVLTVGVPIALTTPGWGCGESVGLAAGKMGSKPILHMGQLPVFFFATHVL
jgi:hypothetical protein